MRALADAGVRSRARAPARRSATSRSACSSALSRARPRVLRGRDARCCGRSRRRRRMAIDNSRLFEEERTSRREAEALREVAEELESTADLRAVARPRRRDRGATCSAPACARDRARAGRSRALGRWRGRRRVRDVGRAVRRDARPARARIGRSWYAARPASHPSSGEGGRRRSSCSSRSLQDGARRGVLVLRVHGRRRGGRSRSGSSRWRRRSAGRCRSRSRTRTCCSRRASRADQPRDASSASARR